MYPSAHLTSGLIVVAILTVFNLISPAIAFFILLGAIIPDFDFILSRWAPDNNHRKLVTHTFALWLGFIAIDFFLFHTGFIFWISFAAIIHLLLDIFDWGIMIKFPLSRSLNKHLLDEKSIDFSSNNFITIQCNFLREYFTNRYIISIEILLGVLSCLAVLLFFNTLAPYFLIYLIIIVSELAAFSKGCKR